VLQWSQILAAKGTPRESQQHHQLSEMASLAGHAARHMRLCFEKGKSL
jgi:hypothetical protein